MRHFDGIICFGGSDWWYHNRGHYDIQMMRRLHAHVPVLYVNSLGVRVPSLREGGMFMRRVSRKLRSWRRGFVWVERSFGVISPISMPGALGASLTRRAVLAQIRAAGRKMGIKQPLIWIECPTAVNYLRDLRGVGSVYQRTDRYEDFPGVDAHAMSAMDRTLKEHADVTLFCSTLLFDDESSQCRSSRFIDHGVDADRFIQAGLNGTQPADLRRIATPRVGFIGGIDGHTFDPDFFLGVASRCAACQFILVGACTLADNWCRLPNIHLLGQRPYEEVAGYMAACDVLIMPWRRNRWIEACNPVKLKEYLAVGRPVVSTPFHELHRFRDLVRIEATEAGFAAAVLNSIDDPGECAVRRDAVRHETWDAKAQAVLKALADDSITPRSVAPATAPVGARADRRTMLVGGID